MKFSIIFIFLTLSISGVFANDVYLQKAGWEKQSDGWMDPETGIIWGPEAEKMSWGEAKSYCQSLKLGQKNSWRLPTVEELQRSVCKVTGYMTRTACPTPRDHQKDLWLLNSDKGSTYWASDLIPGDPYNAYYFAFDVEGQQIITSKGDKSKLRCVSIGTSPKAVALVTAVAAQTETAQAETTKTEHTFYIAPFIGAGAFFTNESQPDNSIYLNGEIRVGYKLDDNVMLQASIDTGLNAKRFSYPVITTVVLGPEYFFLPERLSIFMNFGLGLVSTDVNFYAPGTTGIRQTSAAFAWRAGATLAMIKWGNNGQYNIPISVAYSGYKSNMMLCHTALLSIGFMYFN